MNIYTIDVKARIEIFANSDEEALEKTQMQLLEEISENAEISILSNEEYN